MVRYSRHVPARLVTGAKAVIRGQSAVDGTLEYRSLLLELHHSGIEIVESVGEVLARIGLPEQMPDESHLYRRDRIDRSGFPALYDSGERTLEALFRLTRLLIPSAAVETGVANGLSTRAILNAMRLNGRGRLVSFDVDPAAGESVGEYLRSRWDFQLLDQNPTVKSLRQRLDQVMDQSINLWYHDSDHTYKWQRAELELAIERLTPGGVLVSDDIDGNLAFRDVVKENEEFEAVALFDKRKLSGFAWLRGSRPGA